MENAVFIGLSRQIALERQMNTVSNNIANMNTAGYRAQNMVFSEHLVDPESAQSQMSMVNDYGQYESTADGPVKRTGNPMDVAMQGPGFLGVQSPDGTAYSRDGRLSMNINGELVNSAGMPVVDDGGNPITIPGNAREVNIAEDGTISTEAGTVAKLMMVEFDDPQMLEASGDNLYRTDAATKIAAQSRVIQGAYEGSNVKGVLEMSKMIEVSRQFQGMQRMLQNEHERQQSMIQKLSQSA